MIKKILLAANLLLAITGSAYAEKGGRFDRMDTDSNGTVSQKEFLTDVKTFFKKLDKNSDGELSLEEFRSHKRGRKEGRRDADDAEGERAEGRREGRSRDESE